MKSKQILLIVGGVAAAAGAVWLLAKLSAPQATRGVTSTTKGPTGDSVTTTPIQPGQVAFVAPRSTLSLIAQQAADKFRGILSSSIPVRSDIMQPFGNPVSAEAAYTSPSQGTQAANYRPSGYAIIK